LTARALIKPIFFSKDKLNEELPQPLRYIQAIVDFQETKDIQNGIQKLVVSLKKINSFTCDYNYNILPIKRDIPFLPNADFVNRDEDLLNLYLELKGGLNKVSSQVGLGKINWQQNLLTDMLFSLKKVFTGYKEPIQQLG
jgi:hypothetical protein